MGSIESIVAYGPLYFNAQPNLQLSLTDSNILDALTLNVKTHGSNYTTGSELICLSYKIYYKLLATLNPRCKLCDTSDQTILVETNFVRSKITKVRGKDSYIHRRGRSSPSLSRSSYGSSSSSTPIIYRGGMSLYNFNSRAQENASSSIHLEDIPESDLLYAKLQEFLTQKQSDSFASFAKEEVDDNKTYEKRYLVNGLYFSGESYKTQKYYEALLISIGVEFQHFSGYNTSENVYNFSKMIIKHAIHIEDWGISLMIERQFSLNKVMAFNKVLCYNNERHKHTWFIKEQISCIYKTYYNNIWDKLMKKDPQTKSIYGQELLNLITKSIHDYKSIPNKGIMTDDSTSEKHMARKISKHDEGEQNEMIMKYLEEVQKMILLNVSHYAKSDSSMRSETSEDMHKAQPYEEESLVDALKEAKDFLAKLKDKM
ncbi:hypothetical protein H5410_004694 [Solanum commersonii]|uniref:Uncharacterized protein n=1 Tax=Solanum commersonii TaxID=4109 RepID=A0A9J6B8J7_SOLCO|nr:hypothetical protein H5410_004694 [Solanum commersonii]